MTDTTIVGGPIEVNPNAIGSRSAFSWSVAFAGALAAIAVSIIFYALGTGIGLTLISPASESNPSAETMTVVGAVWLIISQTFAFATGGYIAARLRTRAHIPGNETRFRDAAHGFMSWAIGVIIAGVLMTTFGMFTAGSATAVTTAAVGGAATNASGAGRPGDTVGYFVDALFRTDPMRQPTTTAQAAPGAPTTSGSAVESGPSHRDEVMRILVASVRAGRLADDDRAYLAKLVAARTGMSEQDAAQRVSDVETRARQAVTNAAETARKATAYMSFWTFMALLFGAVAGSLGGMVGGALRDDEWSAYEEQAAIGR